MTEWLLNKFPQKISDLEKYSYIMNVYYYSNLNETEKNNNNLTHYYNIIYDENSTNITKITYDLVKINYKPLYNYIKNLENQYREIDIGEYILSIKDGIIISIINEIENNHVGIDRIVAEYEYFSEFFKEEFDKIIDNEINDLEKMVLKFNDVDEMIKNIFYLLNNYSSNYIEEISEYNDKLRFFGLINGFNFIPIEMSEKLRYLWDFAWNEEKRKLQNTKSQRSPFLKNKKDTYKKYINSKTKKNILDYMKNTENTFHNLRNLEEYNTRSIFNCSCDPLTIINITNLASILEDDIDNFKNLLVDKNFNMLVNKYQIIKQSSTFNELIIEFKEKIIKNELYLAFST